MTLTTHIDMTQTMLQRIITLAQQDTPLMGMVSGVYDYVPQGTLLPYVRCSYGRSATEPARTVTIARMEFYADIWTDYHGMAHAWNIAKRIETVWSLTNLRATAGMYIVSWHMRDHKVEMKADAPIRCTRLRFDAVTRL
ncbi:MAG: DUF3168 domain-containing protein [Alphaproteobacteria bacterium]|nr:MAG: DUF3168 domain-containing protein [Alphaproteobacteria bacterium]